MRNVVPTVPIQLRFQIRLVAEQLVLIHQFDAPGEEILPPERHDGLQHIRIQIAMVDRSHGCGPRSNWWTNWIPAWARVVERRRGAHHITRILALRVAILPTENCAIQFAEGKTTSAWTRN